MSAPHEVWVTVDDKVFRERQGIGPLRYLRADLTCGECMSHNQTFMVCKTRGISVVCADLACMAFVSKEEE